VVSGVVGDAAAKANHPTPGCGRRFAAEGQSMTDPNSILGKSEHEYLGISAFAPSELAQPFSKRDVILVGPGRIGR